MLQKMSVCLGVTADSSCPVQCLDPEAGLPCLVKHLNAEADFSCFAQHLNPEAPDNNTLFGWNYYPDPASSNLQPDQLRLLPHADTDVITLLFQKPGILTAIMPLLFQKPEALTAYMPLLFLNLGMLTAIMPLLFQKAGMLTAYMPYSHAMSNTLPETYQKPGALIPHMTTLMHCSQTLHSSAWLGVWDRSLWQRCKFTHVQKLM